MHYGPSMREIRGWRAVEAAAKSSPPRARRHGASTIRLVLRDAVAMIAVGIAIALPCVAALGKLVQSQLFGVTATDPATIAAAAAVLGTGALAVAFIPASRASNVSPTDALRLD